jgi:hypothetical protein
MASWGPAMWISGFPTSERFRRFEPFTKRCQVLVLTLATPRYENPSPFADDQEATPNAAAHDSENFAPEILANARDELKELLNVATSKSTRHV